MPTFTNTHNQPFQDGDLVVMPGEGFTTEDEGRVNQMRGLYKWRFSEDRGSKNTPTEAEMTEAGPAKPVRELRDTGFVKIDEDGNQAELVSDSKK